MTVSYDKVDDNTLRKTETVELVSDVSLDALIDSRANHVQAKADAVAYHDSCIADIDEQITQAGTLSLKTQAQIAAEQGAAAIAADNKNP